MQIWSPKITRAGRRRVEEQNPKNPWSTIEPFLACDRDNSHCDIRACYTILVQKYYQSCSKTV